MGLCGLLFHLGYVHLNIDFIEVVEEHIGVQRVSYVSSLIGYPDGFALFAHQLIDNDSHIVAVYFREVSCSLF